MRGVWERPLAMSAGWCVEDIVCSCTPHDRPFEEQHADVAIAIVAVAPRPVVRGALLDVNVLEAPRRLPGPLY